MTPLAVDRLDARDVDRIDVNPTHPHFSAFTSAANLALFILGGILVWLKPRLGYFLVEMGFASFLSLSFMSSVPGRGSYFIAWHEMYLVMVLPPALWFFRACVKDEAYFATPKTFA
jgi:hypothetical protein